MVNGVDRRALKILSNTYWSATGWRQRPETPAEDLAYAKAAGMMFDPIVVTHDQVVDWALRARRLVSKEAVVAGFLESLRSRRLELRSALGSFAVLRHFPAHRWQRAQGEEPFCPVCGYIEWPHGSEDLNVLNFERFKWGGVRHSDPVYAAFDLERFAAIAVPEPTGDDHAKLRQIVRAAREAPEGTGLAGLAKALATEVPSNAAERRTLIGILGYCGILRDPGKPGYFEGFPHRALRPDTPWRNDWPYPVQWWNASHGVNADAVSYWFPAC